VVIGRNYSDRDDGAVSGAAPLAVFFKPPTSLIKPGEAVRLPSGIGAVRFEGELAVVIGRRCKYVPAAAYQDVVLGYTCADDVTAWDVGTGTGHYLACSARPVGRGAEPWIRPDSCDLSAGGGSP
jgi:2-keto-4-pentenoate hydratase/2-oxohepta-3-ene-1,7-dioic acid hydratase in catechol pathway